MPKLPSDSPRLARRMVQDRRAVALQRVGGNGLPVMRAPSRISTREDWAGTAWSLLGETVRGQGSGMGRLSGRLRGRNVARLYIRRRSRSSVRELLDGAGS